MKALNCITLGGTLDLHIHVITDLRVRLSTHMLLAHVVDNGMHQFEGVIQTLASIF